MTRYEEPIYDIENSFLQAVMTNRNLVECSEMLQFLEFDAYTRDTSSSRHTQQTASSRPTELPAPLNSPEAQFDGTEWYACLLPANLNSFHLDKAFE